MESQQSNPQQNEPDVTGRMGREQQLQQHLRETGGSEMPDQDAATSDNNRQEKGPLAPDETEFGMDKEDYRSNEKLNRSDRRL